MLRRIIQRVSPAGAGGRLSVMVFHRVHARSDPLFPDEMDAARFEQVCVWVKSWFQVLPLGEAVRLLAEGRLPASALAITFDDGYVDNHLVALPILKRHGLSATFFVATGFLQGGCMWNDAVIEAIRAVMQPSLDLTPMKPLELGVLPVSTLGEKRAAIDAVLARAKYLPHAARDDAVLRIVEICGSPRVAGLMMSAGQVLSMHRGGMQIGAHTVTHPILARLPLDAARCEMAGSKLTLEQIIGEPIDLFAYPNGKPGQDYAPEHAALARDLGFRAAVTTAWGAAHRQTDPFQLPRFTPWDRSRMRFGARMLGNLWASRQ